MTVVEGHGASMARRGELCLVDAASWNDELTSKLQKKGPDRPEALRPAPSNPEAHRNRQIRRVTKASRRVTSRRRKGRVGRPTAE